MHAHKSIYTEHSQLLFRLLTHSHTDERQKQDSSTSQRLMVFITAYETGVASATIAARTFHRHQSGEKMRRIVGDNAAASGGRDKSVTQGTTTRTHRNANSLESHLQHIAASYFVNPRSIYLVCSTSV